MPETITVTVAKVTAAGAEVATMAMTRMAEAKRRVMETPRAEAKRISLRTVHHIRHLVKKAEAAAVVGDHAPPKDGSGILMKRTTTIISSVQSASRTGSESSQFRRGSIQSCPEITGHMTEADSRRSGSMTSSTP